MPNITLQPKVFKHIILFSALFFSINTIAQIKQNFTPRYSDVVNGDISMIGNNVLSINSTTSYTGDSNNNDISAVFVDIDNDNTTFNSSNATYSNPSPSSPISCLNIVGAYLYWAAADKEYGVAADGTTAGNGGSEPNWDFRQVKLMLPGSNSYNTVTADQVIFNGRAEHFDIDPYVCVKDITADVQALSNPFGVFQVGNVKATEETLQNHDNGGTTGTSGGWQIVFVYESPELTRRTVTFFDGYAQVTRDVNNFDVLFDGFQTVPNGRVNANILVGALEGDRSIDQDRLEILDDSNVFTAIETSERDENNFFNSKITVGDNQFLDRVPASTNTLGFDAALFPLKNNGNKLIDNNQTSTTIRMTSDTERYGLYLLGMSIEVFEPSLGALNFTTNIVGSTFSPGDTAPVEIRVKNTGNDNIQNLEISTNLPPQVEFVSTDPLPPGVTYNFNTITRELRFFVQDGNTDVNDPEYQLDFNLLVNDSCSSCSADIELQALATFTGETNTNSVGTLSSGTVDACGVGNNDPTYLSVIPNITISDSSADEGQNVVFTIQSSHQLTADTTFDINYTDGTANSSDYNGGPTSVTIPNGSSNVTFNVAAVDDDWVEPTQQNFTATINTSSNGINITDNEGIGTVIDTDIASVVGGNFDITEGGTIQYRLFLSSDTQGSGGQQYVGIEEAYNVDFAVEIDPGSPSPATGDVDFNLFSTTITFPANSPAGTEIFISVPTIQDDIVEPSEEFNGVKSRNSAEETKYGTAPSRVNINTERSSLRIHDNDTATITLQDITVLESVGSANYEFVLSGNVQNAFDISFATADGSALAASDYTSNSGTINFTGTDGQSRTASIAIFDDTIIESSENLNINPNYNGVVPVLANALAANIVFVNDPGTITITDNDNAAPGDGIAFTNATVSVNEGNPGDNVQLSFDVTYTGTIPAGETVSVDYNTIVGTADATDFTMTNGTINFTDGAQSQTILVDVIEDLNIEADENFTVELSNISTVNGFVTGFADGNTTNTATGTIINDDNAASGDGIAFTNATVSVNEGNPGDNVQLSFEVTYTGTIPAGETVSVDYNTIVGTADTVDFTLVNGTLDFTDGAQSQTILVDVIEDLNIEADENFTVELSNISTVNGFVTGFADGNTTNTATGTIINDDNAASGDGIAFTNATVSVNEGNPGDNVQLSFEVTYTGTIPAGETVSVDYNTIVGTADTVDFTLVNGTLDFTDGAQSQTILVDVIEDLNIEADENFTVELSNISTVNGFVTGFADGNTTNTATGTIINDDNAASGDGIAFTNATVSVNEGNPGDNVQLSFEVTYTGTIPAGETVSVDYNTIVGTADATDFTMTNGTINFTDGAQSQTILVDVIEDLNIEADENFTVELSNISTVNGFVTGFADGNTTNTATGTIINDDNAASGDGIAFTNATVSVNEGNPGDNVQLSFEVTYTGTIPAGETVSVDYNTIVGTADTVDFTLVNGTLDFTDGAQSQTILVDVIEDLNIEADENFTVELSNISTVNGFVTGFADGNTTNTATGTIINDDNAASGDGIAFTNATVSVNEGNPGDNVQLSFEVTYTGTIPAGETVSVDYNTIVGTADTVDFTLVNGTLDFTDGAQSQTILVDVIEDLNIEADENFTVELSNISTVNGFVTGFADGNTTNTATGTIINDDNAASGDGIAFTNATVSVNEGNPGDNVQLSFEVTYTGTIPAGETVSVDYNTIVGTADATDFTMTNGTINFTDGAQSQTILVDVIEDLNIEADENFTVELSNISTVNGFVTGFADGNTTNTATGTIINDDNAASGDGIAFTNATVSVNEGNPGDNVQLSFEVTYTGTIPAGETVSVDYNTIVGTADATDFTMTNGTINFTDGAQSQTILVDVIEDLNIEADENFTVELSNISTVNGFVTGFADGNTTNTATGTIINDDNAASGDGIAFTNATVSVNEGNPGDNVQLSFEVTYTGTIPAGETVSVDYSTIVGSADATDFTMTNGTINFTNSNKVLFVVVDVIEDLNIEADENFTVELSNISTVNGFVTGFADGNTANNATGTIINDDNAASGDGIAFTNATVSVNEGNPGDNVQLSFEVTYTGTIPAGETVSVDYNTIVGTADTVDFTLVNGTLDFTDGAQSQTILVDVIEDLNIEADENFTVELSNISTVNGFVTGFADGNTTNTATGTIINDDNAASGDGIAFTNATVSVNEGNPGDNVQLSFEVTYTGTIPAGETVSVDYNTIVGTADATDFTMTNGTINFTDGAQSQTILVDVIEDLNIEADENFTVELSNISTVNGFVTGFADGNTTNTATGTIINDDNAASGDGIAFTNATVSVNEGNPGDNVQLSFDVTYTGTIPAGETVSVDYSTIVGSADATDFTMTNGTINFTNSNKVLFVVVDVIEDLNIEADENFTVELSNISTVNGFVTGFADGNTANNATGTIINDDNAASGDGIAFTNATVSVNEGNPGDNVQLSFEVTYTGTIPAGETVSVDYNTIVGTADTVDFTLVNGTLDFTDGAQSQTILVDVIEDLNIEADENFTVELSNISTVNGFVTGFADGNTTNTATGIILDDDMGEIMVEPYIEEHTIMCGETIPEVPTLIFTGACGNYTVDFTEVEEFTPGTDDYMIVRTWNVTDICGNTASFQQIIFVLQLERSLIEINICVEDDPINLSDYLPADFDTNGTFTVTQGEVNLNGDQFDPSNLEIAEYLISYASTENACKYYADFMITTNNDCVPCNIDDLVISKTITANGDNINDYFELSGLENCDYTYNVKIFNRWGTMVYEAQDYRNNWGGNAPGGSFGSNSVVPTGTYYYIIEVSDPQIKPVNGYIYIGSNQ